jgi:hypothetical protein
MIPLPIMVLFSRAGQCIPLPLVNHDAEDDTVTSTSPPTGWTVTQGNLRVRASEADRPHPTLGGLSIFDGGTSAISRAEQEIDLAAVLTTAQLAMLDDGDMRLKVDWLGGAFIQSPADQPQVRVYFRATSGGKPIFRYSSGLKSPSTAVNASMRWDAYHEEHRVPPGTRYIAVELYADRQLGSNNDASFDNILPEICVEPPAGGDPFFEFVQVMAGFEGADGATTYIEEARGRATTFAGNARIETTGPIEGSSSLWGDGSGDVASWAADSSLAFGQDDWTIEFSVIFDSAPISTGTWLLSKYQASGSIRSLAIYATDTAIEMRLSQDGSTSGTNWHAQAHAFTFTTGTRYDIAWVRKGQTSYLFIAGVLIGSAALPSAAFSVFDSSQPIRLMSGGAGSVLVNLAGRIDEVRITIGHGRYTAAYAPAFPFPRD